MENNRPFYTLSAAETVKALQTDTAQGLDHAEAQKREKLYGKNILDEPKGKSLVSRFFSQFSDFMILILIAAAGISFAVSLWEGHADYVDPIIIFSIILVNAVLGVFQESKAEKSLNALKKMSAPTALVLRSGVLTTIPAEQLVPGDIITLETGHYIPADARLLTSSELKVDESALTGESLPVRKEAEAVLPYGTSLGDRRNLVPSTGIITYGHGTAVVTATGMNTEVGQIATLMLSDETPETPLQVRMEKTGKILGTVCLFICLFLFLLGMLQGRPVFDMFMTSVSLAVAAIPEGLPAIITIMLSLGVQRMAKKNAIVRKLPAVEALGSATVICSDKTGTLTKNEMTVTKICSASRYEVQNGSFARELLSYAALCNNAQPSPGNPELLYGEPTEKALAQAAATISMFKPKLEASYPRIYEIPFDSGRKRMITVHRLDTKTCRVIIKGAPDILLSFCTEYSRDGRAVPLTAAATDSIRRYNREMAEQALRVLGVAYRDIPCQSGVRNFTAKELEHDLIFVGLAGMIDPPRDEVPEAVALCKSAGITPVMITGDHALTAAAIAKQIGILEDGGEVLTGNELDAMPAKELEQNISRYRVFARVSPAHKVKIVKAFRSRGELVAMTGDGVNDAPALKAADIGCSMGKGGTDVAKDASDIILADDNFATIVSAVEEGRGIYDNIRKAIHFLLSCNIGEILTILIAILFGLPAPLLAVQLLWVNLVTDSLPAIALGMERPEKGIMRRRPVSPGTSFFSNGLSVKIILEGMLIGALALIAFMLGIRYTDHTGENPLLLARTMSFAVLSLSQLFHAFNLRSDRSLFEIGLFGNVRLLISFVICAGLQVAVIMLPSLSALFDVVALTPVQWATVLVLAMFPVPIVELQKFVSKKNKV